MLLGQPWDMVKVNVQVGNYRTPLEAFKEIVRNDGVRALYKGTLTPLVTVGVCVSAQFYGFHEAKRQILEYTGRKELTLPQFYVAGASAGIFNAPITNIEEQIRILLQTQKKTLPQFKGPKDAFKKIYSQHGLFRGLLRGYNITLLREVQAYGVWFATYELLIKLKCNYSQVEREAIKTYELMLCGALAGELLWFFSYPLDVIKTRLHSDHFLQPAYDRSIRKVVRVIYRQEGLRGFWRGLLPTMLRAIPCSAGTFTTVEWTLRLLG